MNKIYTAEDAAFRAGVSTRTVVRRITTGSIEAENINGTWAISAAEVEKLVALYAAKSSKKAPDAKPARAQQIAIKTTPAPQSRKTVATYTAVPQNAAEAQLEANRARLAEIAKRARAAVLISADGRVGRVKRTSAPSGGATMKNHTISRVVIWFSAGVTSAVAAKIAVKKYQDALPVHLVMCDTGSEDDDNLRFANEAAEWIGLPLEIIRNEKYKDTIDVYQKTGYIVGTAGARCTLELKKLPRRQYENLATDLQVFGYDADESDRAARFVENNPEVTVWFPLIDEGITKAQARQILAQVGIKEPRTYADGFKNANCLKTGCVKGGMGYWNHIRKMRPEVFWLMAQIERDIGHAICSTEERGENGERIKVPVFLDELPPHWGNYDSEPAFQCGLFCGAY